MNEISIDIASLKEAQRQIESQMHKNEKAYKTLRAKQSKSWQVNRVALNVENFKTMLALIANELQEETSFAFDAADLRNILYVIPDYIAQIEKVIPKFNVGTAQHTLAIRRIHAFQIVEILIKEKI